MLKEANIKLVQSFKDQIQELKEENKRLILQQQQTEGIYLKEITSLQSQISRLLTINSKITTEDLKASKLNRPEQNTVQSQENIVKTIPEKSKIKELLFSKNQALAKAEYYKAEYFKCKESALVLSRSFNGMREILAAVPHNALEDVHTAQVLTYLKFTGCRYGLLFNFRSSVLTKGLRRLAL